MAPNASRASYRPSLKMQLQAQLAKEKLLTQFQDFEESDDASAHEKDANKGIHRIDEGDEYDSEEDQKR